MCPARGGTTFASSWWVLFYIYACAPQAEERKRHKEAMRRVFSANNAAQKVPAAVLARWHESKGNSEKGFALLRDFLLCDGDCANIPVSESHVMEQEQFKSSKYARAKGLCRIQILLPSGWSWFCAWLESASAGPGRAQNERAAEVWVTRFELDVKYGGHQSPAAKQFVDRLCNSWSLVALAWQRRRVAAAPIMQGCGLVSQAGLGKVLEARRIHRCRRTRTPDCTVC